jgi:hypothetical protein
MLFSLPGRFLGAFYPGDAEASIHAYLDKASKDAGIPARLPPMPDNADALSNSMEILIQPGLIDIALLGSAASSSCRPPVREEWKIWSAVAQRASNQFRQWGIPVHFTVDEAGAGTQAPEKSISVLHCDSLSAHGLFMDAGQHTIGQIVLKTGEPSATYTHELAHTTSNHPQDVASTSQEHNLAYFESGHQIDPDLMEALCERGGHPQPASNLVYGSACHQQLYGFDDFYRTGDDGFGALELIQSKLRFSPSSQQDAVIRQGTDYLFDWLKENYGTKVAGYFAAAFCKEITDLVFSRAVTRLTDDPARQKLLIKALQMVSSLAQCILLGQPLTGLVLGTAGLVLQSVLMHRSLHAISALFGGAPALGMLVLGIYRGNRHALVGMACAFAGKQAAQLLAETMNLVLQRCRPDTPAQRQAYLLAVRDPLPASSLSIEATEGTTFGRAIDRLDQRLAELLHYLHLHWAYESLYRAPRERQQQEILGETERALGDIVRIASGMVTEPARPPDPEPDLEMGIITEVSGGANIDASEEDRLREIIVHA